MSRRKLSIFGATGSIGDSAFDILKTRREEYSVEVIAGWHNVRRLAELAEAYHPKFVVVADKDAEEKVKWPSETKVLCGANGLLEAARCEVDWALNAIIGAAGLPVSLELTQSARYLALANKETMVAGGALVRQNCQESGCQLLPVDSEHCAIFQCIMGQDRSSLERVILTASGGPFRTMSSDLMRSVTVEDALKHPVWDMGTRITIDSASLFNKALEMIEAKELFELKPAQIDVLVHPQSIVHSFVEFSDKGQLAQLGLPDMRHAIAFALGFPRRLELDSERLDLCALGMLSFERVDETRFPAIRLARATMEAGGVHGAALNAAKEVALDRFMNKEIGFLDMAAIVERVLSDGDWNFAPSDLSVIKAADQLARQMAANERVA